MKDMRKSLNEYIADMSSEDLMAKGVDSKRDILSPFFAKYTGLMRYELANTVKRMLGKYKKEINEWTHAFDWRVLINVRYLEIYALDDKTVGENIYNFMDNLDEYKEYDLNIDNYKEVIEEIEEAKNALKK